MTEIDMAGEDATPKKRSRSLVLALVLALVLGGGGFYGVFSGLVPLPGGHGGDDHHAGAGDAHAPEIPYSQPAFVPLEPFIISLSETAAAKHLKVSLTVEVAPGTEEAVAAVVPRINDVLNTYLRAVDERDLEVPRAMTRLRAHMLRRVRLVTPPDAVRDLLFQEFVLN